MSAYEKLFNRVVHYLMSEDTWIAFAEAILKIIVILVLTSVAIRVGKFLIFHYFKIRSKAPLRLSERRENTLVRLLENILRYCIYFFALVGILETVHLPIKAVLGGAGIIGLAVGFGAQNLVRDIITGFFIIFEDQFSVGDFVRISTFEGTVEEIGLRSTRIKSFTGEVHILPNGSIVEVTNFSINNSVAVVDIGIAYEGDINRAEKVIANYLKGLSLQYEDMTKDPELLGVQLLGPSEVTLRIVSETKPMKHFNIARILRKELKQVLDQEGIEIPFPRLVMYSREEKSAKQEGKVNERG